MLTSVTLCELHLSPGALDRHGWNEEQVALLLRDFDSAVDVLIAGGEKKDYRT